MGTRTALYTFVAALVGQLQRLVEAAKMGTRTALYTFVAAVTGFRLHH